MKTLILAAGAAALALSASSALAGPGKAGSRAAMGPKQPIPYAQLDSYLKASPRMRASKDWWSGQSDAATGVSANTSATAAAPASEPTTSNPAPAQTTSSPTEDQPATAPK